MVQPLQLILLSGFFLLNDSLPFLPSLLRHHLPIYPGPSNLSCILSSSSSGPPDYSLQLYKLISEVMSVNGGGGSAAPWHNGTNGTNGTNGHMGSMKNISEEDYKTYEHGVQVIDENKEFTYVPTPLPPFQEEGTIGYPSAIPGNVSLTVHSVDQTSQPTLQSRT